jgi:hypothetical protein
MTTAGAELLQHQARKDWDNECVGKCPNAEHIEQTVAAERECPYCSKIVELCEKGVP